MKPTPRPQPLPHAVKLRAALAFLGARYACHPRTTFRYTPAAESDLRNRRY